MAKVLAGKAEMSETGSKGARALLGPSRSPELQVVSVCILVNHL